MKWSGHGPRLFLKILGFGVSGGHYCNLKPNTTAITAAIRFKQNLTFDGDSKEVVKKWSG